MVPCAGITDIDEINRSAAQIHRYLQKVTILAVVITYTKA